MKLGRAGMFLIGLLVFSCAQAPRPDGVEIVGDKKIWVTTGDRIAASKESSFVLMVKVSEDLVKFEYGDKVQCSIESGSFDYPTGLQVLDIQSNEGRALIKWEAFYGPN